MKFAGELANAAQHLIRTDHLRDRLRRYEGADLNRAQSGTDQRRDESDARLDTDGSLFILQAVARPHLHDAHGIAHGDLRSLSFAHGFDFGKLDALLHDIANLTLDGLEHARKRSA